MLLRFAFQAAARGKAVVFVSSRRRVDEARAHPRGDLLSSAANAISFKYLESFDDFRKFFAYAHCSAQRPDVVIIDDIWLYQCVT